MGVQCLPCLLRAGWTAVPGVLMDAAGVPGCQVLAVAGRRLEFVINNGGHDWCAGPGCSALRSLSSWSGVSAAAKRAH